MDLYEIRESVCNPAIFVLDSIRESTDICQYNRWTKPFCKSGDFKKLNKFIHRCVMYMGNMITFRITIHPVFT